MTTLHNSNIRIWQLSHTTTLIIRRNPQSPIPKCRVRKPVPKLEPWLDLLLIEIPIINIQPLCEVNLGKCVEGDRRVEQMAVVRLVLGNCVGQAAGGGGFTIEDVG